MVMWFTPSIKALLIYAGSAYCSFLFSANSKYVDVFGYISFVCYINLNVTDDSQNDVT